MATLVLGAFGSLVGGPVGGAIGALVGQAVDSRLFAPKPRQGPRLGDLSVQTSMYGSEIAKLFGTMRVAGTVIWATDLKETKSTSGGGKGQPKSVGYTYSASFAVALSGRRVAGVRRIWADGKLLRGAAGDLKASVKVRLYRGDEAQEVDPLIASVEGMGNAPAYRGLAYMVFEDLQLADFGNRIPSLTFEVDADAGPVTIGGVAAELAGGDVVAGETAGIGGFAASGESVRAAVEALGEILPLSLVDTGETLRVEKAGLRAATVLGEAAGASAPGAGGKDEWTRRGAAAVPSETSLVYYDPARDFQAGLQRAARGGGSARGERRSVPVALAAEAAKACVQLRLETLWAGRETGKIHLPPSRLALKPGAVLALGGRSGLWRVSRISLEKMVLTADLQRLPGGHSDQPSASAGRPVTQPDVEAGATVLVLLDLPSLGESPDAAPRLAVAAAGGEGWRSASLAASFDDGASWAAAGSTAAAAVIGTALTVPGAAGAALFDSAGSFEVELLNDTMWLESRDDAALAAGANLAALGDELLQFAEAEPMGNRRFRLRRLLRGRRGTEWASAGHAPGARFVLIEAAALASIEAPLARVGGHLRLQPHGIGDPDDAAPAVRLFTAENLRPPSPVHLSAIWSDGGTLRIEWVRRSRAGWAWLSGSDTPLGEEREAYRLTLSGGGGQRVLELAEPAFTYSAAERAADGIAIPLTVRVAQLGTAAASREASLTIS